MTCYYLNRDTRGQYPSFSVAKTHLTIPSSEITAVLQLSFPQLALMTKKSEILRMEKAIELEEKQLNQLKKLIERDNLKCEEFLRENEKKSVEARTL